MRRKKVSLPRYNLKDTKSKTPTLIFLVYRYKVLESGKTNRFKYSTGKKILPSFWTGNEAKESLKYPGHTSLNIFLRRLINEVQRIVINEPLISEDELKNRLDIFNGFSQSKESENLTLGQYIEIKIKSSGKDYRTILKYKDVMNKLNQYSKEKGIRLTFERINLDFKNDFINWLYNRGVKSQNTISKIFSTINMFMRNSANERVLVNSEYKPYHNNNIYNNPLFKVSRIKTSKHFLELKELDILANFKSENPSFNLVKDYFLISCYTGLRISDLQRLSDIHFKKDQGQEFIQIHTFKGRKNKEDNEVVIPILPQLKQILLKYNYKLPEPLSEQKHNDYIKQVLRLAGVNRMVLHKANINGEMIESSIPIYTKISNHSGRYTFINFMLNDYNVPPEKLQKITGQSLKVLMNYERGDKRKNARSVLKVIEPNFKIKRLG